MIDFHFGGFDHANLSFSVVKVANGNGLANVGYINSTGHDLGNVTVKGDLGQIDAGDATTTTPGLKSLSVQSLGRLGTDTQAPLGSLESNIEGALGALNVKGDVKDAFVSVTGSANGKIGAVTIGGSLIGGAGNDSGRVYSDGDMGAVKIGHDVQGGSGISSGSIRSNVKLASVTIGGSLLGDLGNWSGQVYSGGDMGAVKIGHDVQGGSGSDSGFIRSDGKLASVTLDGSLIGGAGNNSGRVYSIGDMGAVQIGHDLQGGPGFASGHIHATMTGNLASVTIGGSLIGGSGNRSGWIQSNGNMGAVKIGHDFIGGSVTGTASLDESGCIQSVRRIASVFIGGSIISGIDNSTGALTKNATIRAGNDIGSLSVAGSLIGNTTSNGASPVVISARGQHTQGATSDLAIGKITIGGRVEFANILAGYNTSLSPVNANAQIGPVNVGGDWAASNLVAGASNIASSNTKFGNANDAKIAGGTDNAAIISKIASITIGGHLFGTPASVSTTDHFGFVAEQVGSLKVGGFAIPLTAVPHQDDRAIGETPDVRVHEI